MTQSKRNPGGSCPSLASQFAGKPRTRHCASRQRPLCTLIDRLVIPKLDSKAVIQTAILCAYGVTARVGGVVQGIGTALYEEIPYDEAGQPVAGTLADYLLPGAAEMPAIRIGHLHTPTPHTEYGMTGMGEGGAVAPPAAIANAIRDALAATGAEVNETPITPRRVMAAIKAAQDAGTSA